MVKTKNKDTKTKSEKYQQIISTIASMEEDETIKPTKLFREAGMNVNDTGRDLLDFYESLNEYGFKLLRKKGRVDNILRTDENRNIIKELKNQNKEIMGLKDSVDEIKTILNKKK